MKEYTLKAENEKLRDFIKLVDIYEGEVIDGIRCEADALIELGKLARQTLEDLAQ